jgi:hypothetical protein
MADQEIDLVSLYMGMAVAQLNTARFCLDSQRPLRIEVPDVWQPVFLVHFPSGRVLRFTVTEDPREEVKATIPHEDLPF